MSSGVRINLVSTEKLGVMTRRQKLRYILDQVRNNTVLVLETGLSPTEELELIRMTMEELDADRFVGIEMQTYAPQAEDAPSWWRRLIGRRVQPKRMEVIGPAQMLRTIKKDGQSVEAMILTKGSAAEVLEAVDGVPAALAAPPSVGPIDEEGQRVFPDEEEVLIDEDETLARDLLGDTGEFAPEEVLGPYADGSTEYLTAGGGPGASEVSPEEDEDWEAEGERATAGNWEAEEAEETESTEEAGEGPGIDTEAPLPGGATPAGVDVNELEVAPPTREAGDGLGMLSAGPGAEPVPGADADAGASEGGPARTEEAAADPMLQPDAALPAEVSVMGVSEAFGAEGEEAPTDEGADWEEEKVREAAGHEREPAPAELPKRRRFWDGLFRRRR